MIKFTENKIQMTTSFSLHSAITKCKTSIITHLDSCVCYRSVLTTRSWDSWPRHIVVQGLCTCGFVIVHHLHMFLCTCPSYPKSPTSHQLKCTIPYR